MPGHSSSSWLSSINLTLIGGYPVNNRCSVTIHSDGRIRLQARRDLHLGQLVALYGTLTLEGSGRRVAGEMISFAKLLSIATTHPAKSLHNIRLRILALLLAVLTLLTKLRTTNERT